MGLLFFTIILISIPAIQTRLINKLSDAVFEKINHNIDLEYINIRWFDTVFINGLIVYDTQNERMIKIDRLILDFNLSELITKTSIQLDKAILQGASVDMLKNAPNDQFNLNFFIDEIKEQLSPAEPRENPKTFITERIILTNSRFRMSRDDRERISDRFDQFHFTLENLDANLENFSLKPGDINFDIRELQCTDSATGFDIRELQARFRHTKQSIVFQNMEMKAGRSSISQSMVFDFEKPSSLKEFVDSVRITANVKKSLINSQDLAHFAPALKEYNEYYNLEGFFEGTIKRFNVKNLKVRFGLQSELRGYLSMYGLPDFNETFIDSKITEGRINVGDLAPYAGETALKNIRNFGTVKFAGGFSGFPVDFVSNASFDTRIGKFSTDINLKLPSSAGEKATYSGRLTTQNFNVGVFLGDTTQFQLLDLNGSINGRGFTREDARFYLVSNIRRIGVKGYDYQNIQTDATLAEQFFNGNLKIDDPNLQFNGNLTVDLNENKQIVQVKAELRKAVLDTLRITEKPARLSSILNVNVTGLTVDDIIGEANLDSTHFVYNNREVFIERASLISEKDSTGRALKIQSPLADLDVFGNYDYSILIDDLARLYDEYRAILQNDSKELGALFAHDKKAPFGSYFLNYDINLKNINPVVNLFLPDFRLSANTQLKGKYAGGQSKSIQLESVFDTLTFNQLSFEKNKISIDSKTRSDTALVFGNYHVSSARQRVDGVPKTEGLDCKLDWRGNMIDFYADLSQTQSTNYLKTSGHVEFRTDTTLMNLNPSEFNLIDKIWSVSEQNMVILRKNNYDIRNLSFFHGDQKITINGVLSEDPRKNLFISIRNFEMETLNPLITKSLDGVFNGFIDVKDYFHEKKINSRINIRDLTINKFPVGNLIAFSEFDNDRGHFEVNLSVKRNGEQTMLVAGYVNPASDTSQLDLQANFTNTNLNLIEPFYDDFISQVKGTLDGKLDIGGRINNPVINGYGVTNQGEFTFKYLNTHYKLDGRIEFARNLIDFQKFTLTDNYGNSGTLSGKIGHTGFKQPEYNFNGDLDKLLVLNTTSKDNALYYGTAFASGNLKIYGREKVINISANAKSERGTRFFIPLEGSEEVVQEDFINFVSIRDTLSLQSRQETKKVDLSGISLNFDFELTPDAYCEIIFDLTAGDIIRGRGNGKINLQIDTQGDFNMFGDYEITEGAYNFTLYNIINKEFNIEPGSRISWIGDPYEAILDITANYEQLASLAPVLRVTEDDLRSNPELNRKYPAKVLLDIEGNLSYPEISFGIDVEGYPKNATYNGVAFETRMSAFKTKLATDEQEMKRQVFSLIILRNFSEENAFNVGGSVGKSVSEFISNQISYWVTQFDENLVVDVDLGSLDDEAFNTFQLRLSYSFLNGRLRITRDGGFTDQTTGANAASILGDWSVEYLLSPDGMLRAKIYNKNNFNTLNPNNRSTTTTTGFSISHTKSFESIFNLFRKTRDDNRPVEINETTIDPDAEKISRSSGNNEKIEQTY